MDNWGPDSVLTMHYSQLKGTGFDPQCPHISDTDVGLFMPWSVMDVVLFICVLL
jgi:hypothetical protein